MDRGRQWVGSEIGPVSGAASSMMVYEGSMTASWKEYGPVLPGPGPPDLRPGPFPYAGTRAGYSEDELLAHPRLPADRTVWGLATVSLNRNVVSSPPLARPTTAFFAYVRGGGPGRPGRILPCGAFARAQGFRPTVTSVRGWPLPSCSSPLNGFDLHVPSRRTPGPYNGRGDRAEGGRRGGQRTPCYNLRWYGEWVAPGGMSDPGRGPPSTPWGRLTTDIAPGYRPHHQRHRGGADPGGGAGPGEDLYVRG